MSAPKNDMADIARAHASRTAALVARCSSASLSAIMTSAMTTATNAGIVMPVISAAASKSKRTMAFRVDEHGVRRGEEEQRGGSQSRSAPCVRARATGRAFGR